MLDKFSESFDHLIFTLSLKFLITHLFLKDGTHINMENGLLRIIILDSRDYSHGIREVFPESPSLLVSGYIF